MAAKLLTSARLLNIEVGDRLTKVCVSTRHGKNYQILDSFMFQTPDGAVNDGIIGDADAVAQTLTGALAEHGAQDVKNVIFTLASAKVASREVLLPPVKDNRIKTVIETNAADYFPVDMSNFRVSYSLLERVTGDNPGCRVLVMAAPKTLIEGYIKAADAAGLLIDAIDFCGNSQYQVLRGVKAEGAVMYVDVNVTNTFVTFIHNGVLLLQRNIAAGGDELVNAAIHAAGREDADYLRTLREAGDPLFLDGVMDKEQQSDALSRLVSGIVRSADFFKSDHTDVPITQVVLMGTCSRLAGLRQVVQEETEIDTVLITDVEGIRFVANSPEGVSAYISCIGSLVAPLDLLPEEYNARSQKRKSRDAQRDPIRTGIIIACACAAVGIVISALAVARYAVNVSAEKKMQARISELSYVQDVYDTYVAYKKTDDSLTVAEGYASDKNSQLVAFLSELEMKMPSSILVLSATCDEKGVTMNVTVPGFNEAAVVLSELRSFDSIDVIQVSAIAKNAEEGGATTVSFSVSCGYPVPATATDAAAPANTAAPANAAQ